EQTVVSPATPGLVTSPNPTVVVLGTISQTLKDSATLSGSYFGTGTITFTLFKGATLLDTETVTVSGNGTYSTPTGFTLPTSGTVTGTYQWDATYSGDSNNVLVADNNNLDERVIVSTSAPLLVTQASGAVTLGTTAPTLSDSALLSGGASPTGT